MSAAHAILTVVPGPKLATVIGAAPAPEPSHKPRICAVKCRALAVQLLDEGGRQPGADAVPGDHQPPLHRLAVRQQRAELLQEPAVGGDAGPQRRVRRVAQPPAQGTQTISMTSHKMQAR